MAIPARVIPDHSGDVHGRSTYFAFQLGCARKTYAVVGDEKLDAISARKRDDDVSGPVAGKSILHRVRDEFVRDHADRERTGFRQGEILAKYLATGPDGAKDWKTFSTTLLRMLTERASSLRERWP